MMPSSIKKGMLKHSFDPTMKHRPLKPWEKKTPSQNIPKAMLTEQMRKMTLGELAELGRVGLKVD